MSTSNDPVVQADENNRGRLNQRRWSDRYVDRYAIGAQGVVEHTVRAQQQQNPDSDGWGDQWRGMMQVVPMPMGDSGGGVFAIRAFNRSSELETEPEPEERGDSGEAAPRDGLPQVDGATNTPQSQGAAGGGSSGRKVRARVARVVPQEQNHPPQGEQNEEGGDEGDVGQQGEGQEGNGNATGNGTGNGMENGNGHVDEANGVVSEQSPGCFQRICGFFRSLWNTIYGFFCCAGNSGQDEGEKDANANANISGSSLQTHPRELDEELEVNRQRLDESGRPIPIEDIPEQEDQAMAAAVVAAGGAAQNPAFVGEDQDQARDGGAGPDPDGGAGAQAQ